ncbi:MAG: ABC transporter ATP-binding protein [Spirochaetaceae bacterium]|jgi:oligopeptide/dipeptide ABC transporter ATP-binding protein|nr:ABC transporter ATP-binding protein [Spirochaetaceae bacterium]
MPFVLVRDVSTVYVSRSYGILGKKNRKPVLDHINLEIQEGEIFGLVGESGCGKSTLARAVLGLIDYEGEIVIDGIRQDRLRRREMARKVQAVFQDPAGSLNPVKTIGSILEEPLRIQGVKDRAERVRQVCAILSLVGLDPSYRTRRPSELSGGQRQRVCIGCALMLNPKLIIADEAVSSLDVSVGAQILNLFRDLHQRLGLSLLFISHNLNVVYYLCDRIAVMYRGQIVELGAAGDVYSSPAHPYTQALLAAVPELTAAPEADGEETAAPPPGPGILDAGSPAGLDASDDGACRYARLCPRQGECGGGEPEMAAVAQTGKEPHYARCALITRR